MTDKLPALFVGHGAPTLALDADKGAPLRAWGRALGRPRAVLVVSAHWEEAPVTLGTQRTSPLVYDFYGFPKPLYEVRYPAPGAPEIAARVLGLLGAEHVDQSPARGLDHGVWTPLVHLFPEHDVPVLQLSMPSQLGPDAVFGLGQKLSPLRDEGVLLVGSGNITHNLRAIGQEGRPPEGWAADFDDWVRDALTQGDVDTLRAYRERAPAFAQNHPTEDHWLPLLFALGAAPGEPARFPVAGFELQNLSRRSVELG
ncbi:MAG: dioxygenase [Deltaproteobacteria bacterium]|nr:dioxygenase [Deltaproteobacteria bacterium]MBW2536343.1 dioxygenase [Deltaproteobacteria bacterium]